MVESCPHGCCAFAYGVGIQQDVIQCRQRVHLEGRAYHSAYAGVLRARRELNGVGGHCQFRGIDRERMSRIERYSLISQQHRCPLLEGVRTAADICIRIVSHSRCSVAEAYIINRCNSYYRYRTDSKALGSRVTLAVYRLRHELQGVWRTGCCQA